MPNNINNTVNMGKKILFFLKSEETWPGAKNRATNMQIVARRYPYIIF